MIGQFLRSIIGLPAPPDRIAREVARLRHEAALCEAATVGAYNRYILRYWPCLGVLVARDGLVVVDRREMTTHGHYPCAQRDERRVLVEVLGWQEAGPRPGRRR